VTPVRHVLTIVACGARPAAAISTCVKHLRTRNAPAAKALSWHEPTLSSSTLTFPFRLLTPVFSPSGTLLPRSLQMIMNR